jgi:uncharacterized phage protein (predicted DNA packaging)
MALITLDAAKLHLRLDTDDHDDLLEEEIIPDVSGIILDYLKMESTAYQTTSGEPDDVPAAVKAAVKLGVSAMFENPEQLPDGPQVLSQTVKDLLHRLRDPALA